MPEIQKHVEIQNVRALIVNAVKVVHVLVALNQICIMTLESRPKWSGFFIGILIFFNYFYPLKVNRPMFRFSST